MQVPATDIRRIPILHANNFITHMLYTSMQLNYRSAAALHLLLLHHHPNTDIRSRKKSNRHVYVQCVEQRAEMSERHREEQHRHSPVHVAASQDHAQKTDTSSTHRSYDLVASGHEHSAARQPDHDANPCHAYCYCYITITPVAAYSHPQRTQYQLQPQEA